jgi:metallophosphoesterase superfamily enzyme
MLPASGTAIGDIGVFHGHKWPSPALLKCKTLLMGHLHPVVILRDPAGFKTTKQVWIKAQLKTDQLARTLLQKQKSRIERSPGSTLKENSSFKPRAVQIFVVPSFNDFLGGRAINDTLPSSDRNEEMIGPLLRAGIVDMDNAELYLTDGTFLGTLAQLRNIQSKRKTA